jgi:hypothetical protein
MTYLGVPVETHRDGSAYANLGVPVETHRDGSAYSNLNVMELRSRGR